MIRQECSVCDTPVEKAGGKMIIHWPESQMFMGRSNVEIANPEVYGSASYWVPEEVVTGEINEMRKEITDLCEIVDLLIDEIGIKRVSEIVKTDNGLCERQKKNTIINFVLSDNEE
ncbi:MAG: hypothetical protein GOVbin556_37 [Prokaryotic dsDNA virus sp.]|nr:MAG: hypothetical protein GOVbin556_37 [Prokaryotic dsDNA virus sp.]|tara:strand:+ start:375 stop:722 length:348 start_codon:yes stop_codon:yes gene_type:complete